MPRWFRGVLAALLIVASAALGVLFAGAAMDPQLFSPSIRATIIVTFCVLEGSLLYRYLQRRRRLRIWRSRHGVEGYANIRIISPPDGEAPADVRAAWIGIVLPVYGTDVPIPGSARSRSNEGENPNCSSDPKMNGCEHGYAVRSAIAIERLSLQAPDAAEWWRANMPQMLKANRLFIFQNGCCTLEPSSRQN